jgi:hypothetical protein
MEKVWHAIQARVLYLIFAFVVMIFVSAVKGVGTLTSYGAEFIPLPAIAGLNAGRGSFDAVTAQMLTKLDNGTIQNISWNTAGQMFVSQTYAGLPDTLVGCGVDGMQYNLFGNSGNATSSTGQSPVDLVREHNFVLIYW